MTTILIHFLVKLLVTLVLVKVAGRVLSLIKETYTAQV